jgi:hypothetical protein
MRLLGDCGGLALVDQAADELLAEVEQRRARVFGGGLLGEGVDGLTAFLTLLTR